MFELDLLLDVEHQLQADDLTRLLVVFQIRKGRIQNLKKHRYGQHRPIIHLGYLLIVRIELGFGQLRARVLMKTSHEPITQNILGLLIVFVYLRSGRTFACRYCHSRIVLIIQRLLE